MLKPNAIKRNVVVQNINEEILIYNLKTNQAHCLNKTSALVWQLCDGKRSIDQINNQLNKKLKAKGKEELVWLAINQLYKEGLLERDTKVERQISNFSRREIIKKIGFASVVTLPIVSSVVAPKAIMSQSGGAIGTTCTSPGQCLSNNCVNSTCCSSTSTNSNGSGTFLFCNSTPTSCSNAALTFCCSGMAVNTTGFSFCTPAETECTCS